MQIYENLLKNQICWSDDENYLKDLESKTQIKRFTNYPNNIHTRYGKTPINVRIVINIDSYDDKHYAYIDCYHHENGDVL